MNTFAIPALKEKRDQIAGRVISLNESTRVSCVDRSVKQPTWEERAKRFLKAELKRADVSYQELAKRLKKHGLEETEASVANKLSRGTLPLRSFWRL